MHYSEKKEEKEGIVVSNTAADVDSDASADICHGWSEQQLISHFRNIILDKFSQYTIKENVLVTELVGQANDYFQLYNTRPYQAYKAEWGKPYTFVLCQKEQPKAVVMLGGEKTHSINVKYLISRAYAKKLNIPYINFYTNKPNKTNYIIERIQKFLEQ